MSGTDAAFVKRFIVCYERKIADHPVNIVPNLAEYPCILGVFTSDTVNVLCEVTEIVFRFRLYKFIKTINDASVYNLDSSYGANRGGFVICGLDIYGNKIFQGLCL